MNLLCIVTSATDDAANAMRHSAVPCASRPAPTFRILQHAILCDFPCTTSQKQAQGLVGRTSAHKCMLYVTPARWRCSTACETARPPQGFDTLLSLVCSAIFKAQFKEKKGHRMDEDLRGSLTTPGSAVLDFCGLWPAEFDASAARNLLAFLLMTVAENGRAQSEARTRIRIAWVSRPQAHTHTTHSR